MNVDWRGIIPSFDLLATLLLTQPIVPLAVIVGRAHLCIKLLSTRRAPFVWSCCIHSQSTVLFLGVILLKLWYSSLKLISFLSAHSFELVEVFVISSPDLQSIELLPTVWCHLQNC